MEPWDRQTVDSEIDTFKARGDLTGLPEAEVRRRFGEPDYEMPGMERRSPEGQILFKADKDLRYFQLLPHTSGNIVLVGGRVAEVWYWAKWRKCPPHKVATLGHEYAPD